LPTLPRYAKRRRDLAKARNRRCTTGSVDRGFRTSSRPPPDRSGRAGLQLALDSASSTSVSSPAAVGPNPRHCRSICRRSRYHRYCRRRARRASLSHRRPAWPLAETTCGGKLLRPHSPPCAGLGIKKLFHSEHSNDGPEAKPEETAESRSLRPSRSIHSSI